MRGLGRGTGVKQKHYKQRAADPKLEEPARPATARLVRGQERTIPTKATSLGSLPRQPKNLGIVPLRPRDQGGAGKPSVGHASAYTWWVLVANILDVSGTCPGLMEYFLRVGCAQCSARPSSQDYGHLPFFHGYWDRDGLESTGRKPKADHEGTRSYCSKDSSSDVCSQVG